MCVGRDAARRGSNGMRSSRFETAATQARRTPVAVCIIPGGWKVFELSSTFKTTALTDVSTHARQR